MSLAVLQVVAPDRFGQGKLASSFYTRVFGSPTHKAVFGRITSKMVG